MGTTASARVVAPRPEVSDAAFEAIREVFARIDGSLSNWKDDSALSRLNREAREGEARVEDGDLALCLAAAFDAARRTGGAFDPTVGPLVVLWGFRPRSPSVPSEDAIAEALRSVGWQRVAIGPKAETVRFLEPGMEIDLGGIGKGFALDRARERLAAMPLRSALVDLGGNVVMWGEPPDGRSFRVGVRDPMTGEGIVAVVAVTGGSAATSGDYENRFVSEGRAFGHIMDARSGRPAETDVVSATALAPDATTADAISTALYVGGTAEAERILEAFPEVQAILVARAGRDFAVRASASLEGRVVLEPGFAERAIDGVRFDLAP